MNTIEHFFDMTKEQARQGLKIYKTFAEQTSKTVEYFSVARRMENVIHINIPQLKHVSALGTSKGACWYVHPIRFHAHSHLARLGTRLGTIVAREDP